MCLLSATKDICKSSLDIPSLQQLRFRETLMIATSRIFAVIICCFVLLFGATAQAGLLAVHPGAYNDGNGPSGGAWRGTAPFANGDLAGTVDWAVFTANAFNIFFAG